MITVQVLYFAVLREERGRNEDALTLDKSMTVAELFEHIFGRPPEGFRFAQNQSYVSADSIVQDGDEIAFLPPLGGG